MVSDRRRIVVLGSFLASEWFDLWQRQQEFTTRLMDRGDVVYVERAAGGSITPAKFANRARRMLTGGRSTSRAGGSGRTPNFLRWAQIPSSQPWVVSLNAARVVSAILREFGGRRPDFVYVGAPNEVWAEVLRRLNVPYWYDMPERFLHSAAYATVGREAMRWMADNASLLTVDTLVGRSDWEHVRDDIVVVPHGAKEVGYEPDWDRPRKHVYYVGSLNPAVDTEFIGTLARVTGEPVRVIGRASAGDLGSGVELLGPADGHDIPRILSDAIAGIVPYKLDAFTAGVLPTKIYDYFLAGAPAISSKLPSLEGHFGVYTVDGSDADILRAVERARQLTVNERKEIRDHAVLNSWGLRFEVVMAELAQRGIALDAGS